MLFERSALGEELLVVFKLLNAPLTFKKCYQKRSPSDNGDGYNHVLADSHWELLLKAVGQTLGTAKMVLESSWEFQKAV
jgi:hypothetical protein